MNIAYRGEAQDLSALARGFHEKAVGGFSARRGPPHAARNRVK